ncbi:hypothetical protein EVAR_70758_1 [Eumeta japonica]|uniref:Uncharacterized protein n=1 Tax=Eumeta variegata TaxID=151549 RepID=A0A4C1SES6_EUMVA|nr:hypothetical protein EVAR_70758_1 [Eumeta japonica]
MGHDVCRRRRPPPPPAPHAADDVRRSTPINGRPSRTGTGVYNTIKMSRPERETWTTACAMNDDTRPYRWDGPDPDFFSSPSEEASGKEARGRRRRRFAFEPVVRARCSRSARAPAPHSGTSVCSLRNVIRYSEKFSSTLNVCFYVDGTVIKNLPSVDLTAASMRLAAFADHTLDRLKYYRTSALNGNCSFAVQSYTKTVIDPREIHEFDANRLCGVASERANKAYWRRGPACAHGAGGVGVAARYVTDC